MGCEYIVCLVLSVFLGTVWSKGPYCCAPDQWEGTIIMTQGYATPGHPPGIQTGTIKTFFDFTNQREATYSNIQSGQIATKFQVIKDYNQKVQHTFHSDTGKCEKVSLQYPMLRTCPPYSSVQLSPAFHGGVSEGIEVDYYQMTFPTFTETFGFTTKDCLPFSRQMAGNVSGTPMLQLYSYVNVTETITNPSVFDLPKECQ